MAFVLAHLSDAHIGPIPQPSLRELAGKRMTGYANWLSKRAQFHDMDVLARIVADIAAQQPDHVVMTGDIVNIGLDAEIEAARDWLMTLGGPEQVSFTPGNHDAYVRAAVARVAETFAPWTSSEAGAGFPYLRRRGGIALIGLDSAVPTAPFVASGRLGSAQLGRLGALLEQTREEGLARVVLLHHPPHQGGAKPLRGLDDAGAFEATIARHGAELVLHGHNHAISVHRLPGRDGSTPVVGTASASAKPGAHYRAAAYNLYSIERGERGVVVTGRSRGVDEGCETVGDLGPLEL
ncbi:MULTISPECIES: metallophosphoesterase family protein [Methylosinus]|uniref:Metallophosphatase n=1 Tax=Methylosinus trichosporium (strain ATCC 35070 / NCIMB 11131 / UNIQEM 75 / OB3b) TaxID=595536 RepID=A0A2D2CV55_METT3|nr:MULTISPECIES: metallophosphoesterase [Methylosinus]ATQ66607.1 metallophosphatase [Methylosinus trichosporium OB3b]OBS51688.1 metallophosphatase [Methylosinus sp. 3S-1]